VKGGAPGEDEARGPARRHLQTTFLVIIGIAVSVAFGYLALEKISIAQVRDSLSGANYIWVVPAGLLLLPIGALKALRWKLLFNEPEQVPIGQSFAALSIGLMFNNLLPSRAGEVPRILALRRTTGLSGFEIGATVVVERILDLFVIALIGAALWPLFPDRAWIRVLGLICVAIVAGFGLLLAVLALLRERLPPLLTRLVGKVPFVSQERAREVIIAVGTGSRVLMRPRRLTAVILLSALLWGVGALSVWVLFPALDLQIGAAAPWLILVASSFAIAVPSGPATVGVYEASVQAALIAYGISPSVGLTYAIVLHAVNFFPIILIGMVCSWWVGRHPAHTRVRGPALRQDAWA
jgi:glycosyltransferase 2 family protein